MQLTTPTTVAQAIAPFEKVKTNLKAVITKQAANRKAAETQKNRAKAAYAEATARAGATITIADTETKMAEELIAKLDALLGTDSTATAK